MNARMCHVSCNTRTTEGKGNTDIHGVSEAKRNWQCLQEWSKHTRFEKWELVFRWGQKKRINAVKMLGDVILLYLFSKRGNGYIITGHEVVLDKEVIKCKGHGLDNHCYQTENQTHKINNKPCR